MSVNRKGKTKPHDFLAKTEFAAPKPATSPEISASDIPIRLKEDICRWKREIDKHRDFFMGKGINPFREAHEILLSFLNNFDMVAGMKAK